MHPLPHPLPSIWEALDVIGRLQRVYTQASVRRTATCQGADVLRDRISMAWNRRQLHLNRNYISHCKENNKLSLLPWPSYTYTLAKDADGKVPARPKDYWRLSLSLADLSH